MCKLQSGRWASYTRQGLWMATVCTPALSQAVSLLPGNLSRFGRDLELLRGGLLRLARVSTAFPTPPRSSDKSGGADHLQKTEALSGHALGHSGSGADDMERCGNGCSIIQ